MSFTINGVTYQGKKVELTERVKENTGAAAWWHLTGPNGGEYTLTEWATGNFRLHRGIFGQKLGDFLSREVGQSEAAQ